MQVNFLPLNIVVCPTFLHTTDGPLAPIADSKKEVMMRVKKATTPRLEIKDMLEMLGGTYERKVNFGKAQKVG